MSYQQPYTPSRGIPYGSAAGGGGGGGLTNPVDYIQYKTAPAGVPVGAGVTSWNDTDKTLDLQLEGGSILQIGEETLLRAVNNTGSTIPNGSVVYVSGASGNRPQISLADADTVNTAQAIGLATQDILNNQTGYITLIGLVRDVDTDGMVEGSPLFVSQTAGEFTTTAPAYPAQVIPIGYVIRAHAVNGMVLVYVKTLGDTYKVVTDSLDQSPLYLTDKVLVDSSLSKAIVTPIAGDRKIQLGLNASLDDLNDVVIDTPVAGSTLEYNGTEWVNKKAPRLVLGVSQFGILLGGQVTKSFAIPNNAFIANDWLTFDIWIFLFSGGSNQIIFNIPEIAWTYTIDLPNISTKPIRITAQYLDEAFLAQVIGTSNELYYNAPPPRAPLGFTFNTTFKSISGAGLAVEMLNVTQFYPT